MGKALAIIAGLLGLVAVFLGFILPDMGAWFRMELIDSAGTLQLGMWMNGIGMMSVGGALAAMLPISGIATFELIGGVLCILGCILCISGGAKESKGLGIVGGIMILLGPLVLIMDLMFLSASTFDSMLLIFGAGGQSILFGSVTVAGATVQWGLWIGSFLALGAGVLGIIGGAVA